MIPPSLLLQRYYEASLIYREVLRLESASAEAMQELKRAQTLHLMVGEAYVKQFIRQNNKSSRNPCRKSSRGNFTICCLLEYPKI